MQFSILTLPFTFGSIDIIKVGTKPPVFPQQGVTTLTLGHKTLIKMSIQVKAENINGILKMFKLNW